MLSMLYYQDHRDILSEGYFRMHLRKSQEKRAIKIVENAYLVESKYDIRERQSCSLLMSIPRNR